MPSIPLVQRSPLGATFETAQQSGPRVRINTAELTGAYEGLKEAVQTGPRYRAAPNGLQELGQGIEHLGEVGIQLAKQNQQNTDIRKATDVRNNLAVSQEELQTKFDESREPDKFPQMAVDHTSEAIGKMDTDGMSEEQKAHLMLYAQHWQDMTVARAKHAMVIKNQTMATESLEANIHRSIINKDPEGMVESITQLERMRVITHEQAADRRVTGGMQIGNARIDDLEKEAKTLALNGNIQGARTLVDEDPTLNHPMFRPRKNLLLASLDKDQRDITLANSMAENPNSFVYSLSQRGEDGEYKYHKEIKNDYERQQWIARGVDMQHEKSTEATNTVNRMMNEGQIIKPEQLNTPEWKAKLTPDRYALLKHTITKGQPPDPSTWMAYSAAITAFRGVDQPQIKKALVDMEAAVTAQFQGPYRESLLAMIKDKANGSDHTAKGSAKALANAAYADGELGNWKVPYAKEVKEWKPWWWPGHGTDAAPGTMISPADQARADAPKYLGNPHLGTVQKNPQKLDVGETVVDIRRREQSAYQLMEINAHLDDMEKAGATAKEMMDYTRQSIYGVKVAPANRSTAPAVGVPETGNEPQGLLFPDGSRERAEVILNKHATH